MTLPSSCTPARLAVVNALTVATGQPRALTNLFKAATPAEVAQNLADLKKQPRCFVLFRDSTLDGEMENGSSIVVHHVCQITCWYWLGSDLMRAEAETQLQRVEADGGRIRAALCYPGALLTSPAGDDTGLTGHALRSDGYRTAGPVPLPTQTASDPRILKVDHFFVATIDQLQPS